MSKRVLIPPLKLILDLTEGYFAETRCYLPPKEQKNADVVLRAIKAIAKDEKFILKTEY